MSTQDVAARPSAVSYTLHDDPVIPVTVRKGAHETPVWIQQAWEEGEHAQYIRKNGCGHCCVAMALRLSGIPAVTPYDEYMNCRALWGPPDPVAGQDHFLSVLGALKSLRSYGAVAEAYGIEPEGARAAVDRMIGELERGNLVLFLSFPLRPDNPLSSGAHYVLLVGLSEEGEIVVANSSTRARTETLGIQTVSRRVLEEALLPEGGDPRCYDLTWGILSVIRPTLGYLVITPPRDA